MPFEMERGKGDKLKRDEEEVIGVREVRQGIWEEVVGVLKDYGLDGDLLCLDLVTEVRHHEMRIPRELFEDGEINFEEIMGRTVGVLRTPNGYKLRVMRRRPDVDADG